MVGSSIHFCILLGAACLVQGWSERRLLNDLLQSYSPLGRPVSDANHTVTVTLGVALQDVLSASEYNDALDMELLTWLTMEWTDVQMQWDPEEYGNIASVRLPIDKLWVPDVRLYNNLAASDGIDRSVLLVVRHDGTVMHVPPATQRVRCAPQDDNASFQYDWKCVLKYGSWAYDGGHLNLTAYSREVDTSTFSTLSGYDVIQTEAERHVLKYACCPEAYIDVTFTVYFEEQ